MLQEEVPLEDYLEGHPLHNCDGLVGDPRLLQEVSSDYLEGRRLQNCGDLVDQKNIHLERNGKQD